MSSKKVFPAKLEGAVEVPGDKSISQRVAMLASLADGTSKVTGYLNGEDARSTLAAMEQMGAKADFRDDALYITGVAGKLQQPAEPLNMGEFRHGNTPACGAGCRRRNRGQHGGRRFAIIASDGPDSSAA